MQTTSNKYQQIPNLFFIIGDLPKEAKMAAVNKVITMLEDLQKQVLQEGDVEEEQKLLKSDKLSSFDQYQSVFCYMGLALLGLIENIGKISTYCIWEPNVVCRSIPADTLSIRKAPRLRSNIFLHKEQVKWNVHFPKIRLQFL